MVWWTDSRIGFGRNWHLLLSDGVRASSLCSSRVTACPSVLGYGSLIGLPGPVDPLSIEIGQSHALLNAPFQCDWSTNTPNSTRYAQTLRTASFPVVLILSICKFLNLVSHHNPKLLLTPLLTLLSNSALSSLHIFAASTFAGLSSFGSASIDITLMRIFSTL